MAEVFIPRKYVGGASNEIGFKRLPNGTFQRISSEYDNNCHRLDPNELAFEYANQKTLKYAREEGLELVSKEKLPNGEMNYVFERASTSF